jgi:hypothetical protein
MVDRGGGDRSRTALNFHSHYSLLHAFASTSNVVVEECCSDKTMVIRFCPLSSPLSCADRLKLSFMAFRARLIHQPEPVPMDP